MVEMELFMDVIHWEKFNLKINIFIWSLVLTFVIDFPYDQLNICSGWTVKIQSRMFK